MSWEDGVEEVRRREELAKQMGGPEKVARQHAAGRLTVRERIEALLDPGTFHEIGALAGKAEYEGTELTSFRPANFVMGRGRMDGRPVVVGGDDFTVRGGAADASIFQKQVHAEQMANELRLPLVRLVDGTGGGGSVKSLEDMKLTYVPRNPGWEWVVANMGTVPVVALALGPVAGLGVDRDSFFEIGKQFGRSAIIGLARLDGWPVAILASDPHHYAGGWTADASQKVTRFVDLADTFHLPVVHLVDQPGFVIGTAAERAATIRHGSRALAAIYQAQVPWCAVILRKVYGVAGAAHQNAARLSYRYAWPSGDWGSLPLEGGIEAAFKAQLEQADDPVALKAEIEARMNLVRSPFRTAESFMVEEIIDPRDTRPLLCEFAELAAPVRESGPVSRMMRP